MENNASRANDNALPLEDAGSSGLTSAAFNSWELAVRLLGLIRASEILANDLGGPEKAPLHSAVTAVLASAEEIARDLCESLEDIEGALKKLEGPGEKKSQ